MSFKGRHTNTKQNTNKHKKENTTMKATKMKVRVTLTEEMLGMSPADEEVYSKFILNKKVDADVATSDEIEALPKVDEEKGLTVFPRTKDGKPMLWDYQIRGFFKDSCGALRRCDGTDSSKMKAFKKEIDGCIFVDERQIPIVLPKGGKIGFCERPLRAMTMQGERVSLAKSETVPAGSTMTFTITVFRPDLMKVVEEWLDYAQYRGFGQWRNSGKGRATWEKVK